MGNRQEGQPTRAARRASAAPQAGRERARRRHCRLGGWCCNGGGRAKRTCVAVADKQCGGGGGLAPPRPPTALPVSRWLAERECRQEGSPLGAWRRASASDLRARIPPSGCARGVRGAGVGALWAGLGAEIPRSRTRAHAPAPNPLTRARRLA